MNKLFQIIKRVDFNFVEDVSDSFITCVSLIENNTFRGIYIIITSPFKRNSEYVSIKDFSTQHGLCRYKYGIMIRLNVLNKLRLTFNRVICPI